MIERALVTGATGFIGRHLLPKLRRPMVLARDPEGGKRSLGDVTVHRWSLEEAPPAEAFDGIDVVFHLAGGPVAEGRWTAEKKRRIRESRAAGTRLLVQCLERLPRRPRVLVSGSAVGFYGDRGDAELEESSPPGADFLAEVCVAWESEARKAEALGMRVVLVRTGIVLGEGGALSQMLTPFRLGLGGRLGSGRQWMPWIHIDDEVGLLLHAAARSDLSGPMNAASPQPVTNADFTRTLGEVLRRPTFLPMPAFGLRTLFGAEKGEMLLASQRAVPRVAQRTGYSFSYPTLKPALISILTPARAS